MWTETPAQFRPIQTVEDSRPHAVVIGAGFGGLAAAVRLLARGYRVTVHEKLEQAGGRASVFRQDGFTFDAGPTIITLPHLLEELWTISGRNMADDLTIKELTPYYRLVYNDGSHFTVSGDEAAMEAEVRRVSPGDLAGYHRLMAECEKIYRFAFDDLGQKHFSNFSEMLRALPNFIRFRADRSVYKLVSRYLKDERLRIAYSFHPLFIGGNPLNVTGLYALVSHLERTYGVHCALGGTGAIVAALVKLIERKGGSVICNSGVSEIVTENGEAKGVKLQSGAFVPARLVISNADIGETYLNLVKHQPKQRWTKAKFDRTQFSMSLVVWYFGTNKRYDNVDHHTILLGPRYKGLLTDIFEKKILADDFSLYIHRPTATDPSLAPPGCDAFYALSPVPNLLGNTNWDSMAEPYRQRIEQRLSETILPGLKDHIVTSKLITPLDFRDRYSSLNGAAFGTEPRMFQSAWFRPHNRSENVKNLYLVGASTHPGAGVPGVISSARILDQLVPHASALV
jgi:phytoene desaturase